MLTGGVIEVEAAGYMRGRPLNDAFIVVDEARKTSVEQMKMFLTRLGIRLEMSVHE
jgi:phosphate starvation-inducible PhoH-like protein